MPRGWGQDGQLQWSPELVVGEAPVPQMVEASKEPSAVLRVDEEAWARAPVVLLGHGEDLGGAVTGGGLGRPHAHLPPARRVSDQAGYWTIN